MQGMNLSIPHFDVSLNNEIHDDLVEHYQKSRKLFYHPRLVQYYTLKMIQTMDHNIKAI